MRTRCLATLAACLLTAACGGGDSSDSEGVSTADFQVAVAVNEIATKSSTWRAAGLVDGSQRTLTLSISQSSETSGRRYLRADVSLGMGVVTNELDYVLPVRFIRFHGGGRRTLDEQFQGYPAPVTGKSGMSRVLYSGPLFPDEGGMSSGNAAALLSLEPRTLQSVFLCVAFITTTEFIGATGIDTDKFCFAIRPDGSLEGSFEAKLIRQGGNFRNVYDFR